MKPFYLTLLALLSGCSVMETYRAEQNLDNKIEFDLKRLDQDGLYGVSDGKRALSYEFCIPGTVESAQQVMSIDPSVIIYKDSKGRVGCTNDQFLAIGDTFQKDYRITLQQLVNLDYVTKVIEVHFE
ncbi:hypothetical protein ACH42_07710 [Endozoicomonas sp. (ex Bugula neritina AB1)]|nr:hypothetical protein ACH42_07710 [Endozoicomonas sp. (ex Bugula neritina AB1)]